MSLSHTLPKTSLSPLFWLCLPLSVPWLFEDAALMSFFLLTCLTHFVIYSVHLGCIQNRQFSLERFTFTLWTMLWVGVGALLPLYHLCSVQPSVNKLLIYGTGSTLQLIFIFIYPANTCPTTTPPRPPPPPPSFPVHCVSGVRKRRQFRSPSLSSVQFLLLCCLPSSSDSLRYKTETN